MPRPPTKLGEVQYLPHGVTIHHVEPRRFAPSAHYAYPEQPKPEPAMPATTAPANFDRPHPPIFLGEIATAPIEYVVHLHTSACISCGRIHQWSQTYAHYRLRSRAGAAYVDNLSPITGFAFNLPIRTVEIGERTTPICFECSATTSLDALPYPPEPDRIVGTIPTTAEVNTKKKAATKSVKTIDDLL